MHKIQVQIVLNLLIITGYLFGSSSRVNGSGGNYVLWNFRAAPGFFDIVTYEGNGTAGHVIPHQLNTEPAFIICKGLTFIDDWHVSHKDIGIDTHYMELNTNKQSTANTNIFKSVSDTTFTLGSQQGVNKNGIDYVAYLFASDDTNIKCRESTQERF